MHGGTAAADGVFFNRLPPPGRIGFGIAWPLAAERELRQAAMDFGDNCWDCPVPLIMFVALAAVLAALAIVGIWLRRKGYRTRPLGTALLAVAAVFWLLQFGHPSEWGIILHSPAESGTVYGSSARAVLLAITVLGAGGVVAFVRAAKRPN